MLVDVENRRRMMILHSIVVFLLWMLLSFMLHELLPQKGGIEHPFFVFSMPFLLLFHFLFLVSGEVASILIATSLHASVQPSLSFYQLVLFLVFLWPFLFFVFNRYFLSVLLLMLQWFCELMVFAAYFAIDKKAGLLFCPCIFWTSYLLYLSFIMWMKSTLLLGM